MRVIVCACAMRHAEIELLITCRVMSLIDNRTDVRYTDMQP